MKDLYRDHKPNNTIKNKLIEFINIKMLNKNSILDLAPFLIYIGFCMVLYINNSYKAESYARQITDLEIHLKDLRSEYITTKSELMFAGKQTEVQNLVFKQGLTHNVIAPYIIRVQK